MGAGDRYLQPKFTVPMPAGVKSWPFAEQTRAFCPLCDRSLSFCECPRSVQRRIAAQTKKETV